METRDGDWQTELLVVARRKQTRLWVWSAAATAVALVAGVVVGYTLAAANDDDGGGGETAGWIIALVLGVPVLFAVLMWAMFFVGRRRGWRWLQPAPVFGVSRSRRKQVLQAIKRGQHLDGEDERLARDTARRWIAAARWQPWLALVFLVNVVAQTLLGHWWLVALWVVLTATTVAQWWMLRSRARRYLADAGAQ